MRFMLFLLLAPSVAVSIAAGVSDRNPVAMGFVVGCSAPLVLAAALLVKPRPKPLPRKADPAKIARMERELGIEPSERPCTLGDPRRTCDCPKCATKASEAPTTVAHRPPAPISGTENIARPVPTRVIPPGYYSGQAKPPAERTTEDCPRPEGCVIAHPCRKCGADKGQACVGDSAVAPIVRQFLGIR